MPLVSERLLFAFRNTFIIPRPSQGMRRFPRAPVEC